MKYILFYTHKCEPKVKHFNTLLAASAFATKFTRENPDSYDSWVDVLVQGEIIRTYPAWYGPEMGPKTREGL